MAEKVPITQKFQSRFAIKNRAKLDKKSIKFNVFKERLFILLLIRLTR